MLKAPCFQMLWVVDIESRTVFALAVFRAAGDAIINRPTAFR
jgi:hypothetical protein